MNYKPWHTVFLFYFLFVNFIHACVFFFMTQTYLTYFTPTETSLWPCSCCPHPVCCIYSVLCSLSDHRPCFTADSLTCQSRKISGLNYDIKCPCEPRQWVSLHHTGAVERDHLNGIQPSLMLNPPCASLFWRVRMCAVKRARWFSASLLLPLTFFNPLSAFPSLLCLNWPYIYIDEPGLEVWTQKSLF